MEELFRANGLDVEYSRDDGEYYIVIGRLMYRWDRRTSRARDIFINTAKLGPLSDQDESISHYRNVR